MSNAAAVNLSPKKRELLELLIKEKKQKAQGQQAKSVVSPIAKRSADSPAPLSFIQQRLWFIEQLTPGTPAFNIPLAVRLRGILNIELLHKALHEIIQRHETLRTGFAAPQGTPSQLIVPSADLQIPVVDLRAKPPDSKLQEVQKLVTEDCQRSFDLTQPPLLRLTLVLLDNDDQVLIVVLNHLIGDFWSIRLLIKELAHLYQAFSTGQPPSLPELPVQYADYAIWQREWLNGPSYQAELAYWKNQLAGMPEDLDLPFDRPRPAIQSIWGAKHALRIPKAVEERLRALGRQQGASLFMTFLAGWKALLHRYTGQEDIVVGAPVANRNRSEYESMIGPFVNSVLLRTDLSGNPSFLELLARVRGMVFDAFSHQDFPFERLVEVLQPTRNMSRNPLYQTDIILQNAPGGAYRVSGMSFEPLPVETGTSQLDVSLDLREEPDGIKVTLEYDTDLFQGGTISRLISHYLRLLEKVAEAPGLRVAEIPLLQQAEERQLLVEWNNTRRDYDLESVYSYLFEKQVREHGHEIAVICDGDQHTYEELNRRANKIAWFLVEEGIGPDAVTALLSTRSFDFLAAVLAVFKAGGAYLPLDPYHPPHRHRQILQQSRAQIVLCAKSFLPLLDEATRELKPLKVFVLEDVEKAARPEENPPVRCTSDHLAYVLFTSGSTGVPKGVMIHHRGMMNHIWATVELLGMNAADVMVQTASQCFDVSVWQFLTPLVLGGRVHIFKDEITKDPPRLLQEVDRHGITIFQTVPSLLQVALAETRGPDAPKLRALRWMLSGGEASPPQLCRQWFAEYPQIPLVNAFGPSECSDDVTLYPMHGLSQIGDLRVPIGYPLANLRIVVLDRNLRLLPVGVAGELCVSGAGLGRGYLNEPDRTATVFVPDPFSLEPGERMYRSGDRARHLADGRIEFLSRLDHQVKIRGFRIELGEIETLLRAHPAVQEAAVIVNQDSPGDGRLIAYVTRREHSGIDRNVIQDYLRQGLPEYMVPAAFIWLERLPLTRNGKLDRQALPAPDKDPASLEFTAPRNPLEEVLANIWGDILAIEKVSVEQNLFELGAHSLLVTQVVSRIRKAFSVEPPLRAFFEYPTVAGMAKVIEKLKADAQGLSAPPIVRIPRDGNYPLSFTQESMWFLDQTEQDLTAYNVPGAVHMEGALVPVALEAGFNEVLRRHEILRTTYGVSDDRPVQIVHPPSRFELPVVDLSALKPEHRENEALRIGRENAQRPFDLLRGPVLRAFLIRNNATKHLLAVTTHHIAYDMWARELFIYELGALYEQYAKGLPSSLEEPELQWVDYAAWLRNWMQGEVLQQELSYWRKKLACAPPFLDLPIDLPRPPVQSYKGARLPLELPLDAVHGLRALGRKCGVTQFITVLAAFKTLLYRWTSQEHIVLGVPIANRNRLHEEKMMGFMSNLLVFNTELGGNPTFVELLERVRETSLGAYAHQDIPFELLVQDLQPERSVDRPAIFQVSFNYMLKYSAPSVNLSDLTLRLEFLYSGGTPFEITVNIWEAEDGLKGFIEYVTGLFHHSTITRLVGHFRTLMENIVSNPQQCINEISLLSRSERDQLLMEWNNTATQYPRHLCVSQVFEQQAGKTPGAVALEFNDVRLTYREVDERTNQIARYLRDLGVGPEMAVGVCLRRSPELVLVLLGILKAGGAYLPLDATYPPERISFMLEDAHSQILITEREFCDKLPASTTFIICIDEEWSTIAAASAEALPVLALPENLAYIIYTSGSTGTPKGVGVVHRNIVRLVRETDYAAMGPEEVFLLHAPVSFDASTFEIWAALLNGAKLVICPEQNLSLAELGQILKQHSVTTLWLTAGLFHLMVDEHLDDLSGLHQLLAGGDVLSVPHVRRVVENMDCRMINGYGPTENTTFSCCYTVVDGSLSASVPIGKPIANSEAYILDSNMQPVPIGTTGELYLGGEGLARGYVNQPGMTAEKFVPHPHSTGLGVRLYRTGDWVRFRSTGELEFVGRRDGQVKIRGFRIELGEIERVLMQHGAVREAVVIAREEKLSDKRLVAYIVTDAVEIDTFIEELTESLKQHLPAYMIPSSFIPLVQLPLTANGKVDRAALPDPDEHRREYIYVAPRTETEILIAEVFAEVLEQEKVGLHDSFFDAGGHSLLAIQLIGRIRKAFSIDLPLKFFFENPTVQGVAETVQAIQLAVQGVAVKDGEQESEAPVEEGFI